MNFVPSIFVFALRRSKSRRFVTILIFERIRSFLKSRPRVTEIRVSVGGGGKVAIKDFGKISSDYHASITRTYTIPEEWKDVRVAEFERKTIAVLHKIG